MPKTPKKAKAEETARWPELKAFWKVGNKALTLKDAQELLGWREDTPEEKFTEYDLELPNGRRVVFDNNRHNRPWVPIQLKTLKQEHLNRKFRLNPDGIGIGKSGTIMTGQHRIRTFCEAELERQANPEKWGEEPLTMDCILVVGLEEGDEFFRILNTGAPMTAADAFYRQGLFPKQTRANRDKLCTMMEGAIKMLWARTGANHDRYTPIASINEIVEFYEAHPKLADCAVHIFESYGAGPGRSARFSASAAVGAMYLMGCSGTTDRKKYDAKPGDKALDWSLWDKAHDFWTLLCSNGDEEFGVLRDTLDLMTDPLQLLNGLYEKKSVLAKAWNLYRAGTKITAAGIKLASVKKGDKTVLNEFPDFGGIDMNEGRGAAESEVLDPVVEPEEVEERIEEVREKKTGGKTVGEDLAAGVDKEREVFTRLKAEHRNKIVLLVGPKEFTAWEEDADIMGRLFNLTPKRYPNGMKYVGIPAAKQKDMAEKLRLAKKKAVVVIMKGEEVESAEDLK